MQYVLIDLEKLSILAYFRFSPCHSSSCFLALRGEVLVGAVWARPLFPPTASLLPSSSSLTGLYLPGDKTGYLVCGCSCWRAHYSVTSPYETKNLYYVFIKHRDERCRQVWTLISWALYLYDQQANKNLQFTLVVSAWAHSHSAL